MGIIISWEEKYSIGDDLVDSQHKHLFSLVNSLDRDLDEASAKRIVMDLYTYTREHFSAEETIMKEHGYPDLGSHQQKHEQLISNLNIRASQSLASQEAIQKLREFIYFWLTHHILYDDTKLFQFIKGKHP